MGFSGGGGSTGEVDYPEYMKKSHGHALDTIWAIVEGELGSYSPYAGWSSADPNGIFGIPGSNWETPAAMLRRLRGSFPSSFNLLDRYELWLSSLVVPDYVSTQTAAQSAAMATRLEDEVLPRFRGGMLDIGAACQSSFTIGQAVIEKENTRLVNKFDAEARMQHLSQNKEVAIKGAMGDLEWGRQLVVLATEITRMYLAAKFEIDATTVEMAAKDRRWDVETFEYYNHVLAAIAGAAVSKGNATQPSALGGALSGAAMGAMAGNAIPGVGTGVGAIVGGIMGLAGGLF